MLSWYCVAKNIVMSLLFLLFVGAFPSLWILSPIDVTLYFNGLGIFDCISRACWSKCMYSWSTVSMNYWTDNMSTAITNKQRREISHLEYVFISRQVRGNRLLIHGELYQRTLKQDVLKQRPSSLASKNICVDCLAIVRLKLTNNRRPKHSLWLNKRYIWNSRTKIVNRSTQQRYRRFYRQNKSLSIVVQLSRPCWTHENW